jgi:hypothetical protein
MVEIAKEVERSAPRANTQLPATPHVESSYAEALDSVSPVVPVPIFYDIDALHRFSFRNLSSELLTL